MPVSSFHELYIARQADWQRTRDSIQGESVIKARRNTYLPIPPGMAISTNEVLENGKRTTNDRYSFYLTFAEFPELIAPAINGFQGIIHTNEPKVELPEKMQYLLEDATPEGEPLNVLWERITREILITGRVGLLCDVGNDDLIRIATYTAENIINWNIAQRRQGAEPNFVVVREFTEEPRVDDPFLFDEMVLYRELRIRNGEYQVKVWKARSQRVPVLTLSGNTNLTTANSNTEPEVVEDWQTPVLFGRSFSNIPIIVLNTEEVGFDFDSIPILPLVRRVLAIYRKSADYHRALYIKGDPQPVISGITQDQAPSKIGGDSIWCLPNPAAKATYLDIDGDGIPLMRQAINDEFERFYQEGGRLLDTADRSAESGEAIRRRQAANQVSLRSIAQNSGSAMQFALRKLAVILGADPEKVKFEADLNFAEPTIEGRDLLDIMAAKAQGAPYSQKSIHSRMRRGGLTQMTFEEETDQLSTESAGVDGLPEVKPNPEVEGTGNEE